MDMTQIQLCQYPQVICLWLETSLIKKDKTAFELALSTFLITDEIIRKPVNASAAHSFMNSHAQVAVFKCFPGGIHGQQYIANPLSKKPIPQIVNVYGSLEVAAQKILAIAAESEGISFAMAVLYRLVQEQTLSEDFWQMQSQQGITHKLMGGIKHSHPEWAETLKVMAYKQARLQLLKDLDGPDQKIVAAEHQLSQYLSSPEEGYGEIEDEKAKKVRELFAFLKTHPEHLAGSTSHSSVLINLRQPLNWECSDAIFAMALKEMIAGRFGTFLDHRSKQDFLMLGCKFIEFHYTESFPLLLELMTHRGIHVDEPIGIKAHLKFLYNWYECDLEYQKFPSINDHHMRWTRNAKSLMEKALFNNQEWARDHLLSYGAGWNRRINKHLRDFAELVPPASEKETHRALVGILKSRFEQWQLLDMTSRAVKIKGLPEQEKMKRRSI